MRRRIGYAKLGRSMPLRLDRCNSLGGDVEMIPTLQLLAERHPDVEFILVGRNSGEKSAAVGLPSNVTNPWIGWAPRVRDALRAAGVNYANLSVADLGRAADILEDITGPMFDRLDGLVMWLGQHGTSNQPLPAVGNRTKMTKPYDWSVLYGSYLLRGINRWRDVNPWAREEVLLNADPRNYPKLRDTKWPWRHPIISQYDAVYNVKHERYGDDSGFEEWSGYDHAALAQPEDRDRIWRSTARATYDRLEISALVPGTPFANRVSFNASHHRQHDFGIIVNETRREVNPARARRNVMLEWVFPAQPGFVRGSWSTESLNLFREQGVVDVREIRPVPVTEYFAKLQTTRCTFTTPASGSGWATAKPWECFAAGVVCFFHPAYDDQNHILGDAPPRLREWLRVSDPDELRDRIRVMAHDPRAWRTIITLQRAHFENAVSELTYLRNIERRLGL
jgi:hypothetical protein